MAGSYNVSCATLTTLVADSRDRTNDPQILARYSGVFKSGCSAGMCISFGVDGAGVEYLTEAIWEVSWTVCTSYLLS